MNKDSTENKKPKRLSNVTKIFLYLSLILCVCSLSYFVSLNICDGIIDGFLHSIRGPHPFVSYLALTSFAMAFLFYFVCLIFFIIPLIHSFFSGAILKNLLVTLAGIIIAFLSSGLLVGTFQNWRSSSIKRSIYNIEHIYEELQKYAEKHDGFLPPLAQWYIALIESDPNNFILPSDKKGDSSIGYGINLNMEGNRLKEIPPQVVFIFDTIPFEFGASCENKLSSTKHNGKGCVVLYGDLHLEFVKTEDFNNVRWNP